MRALLNKARTLLSKSLPRLTPVVLPIFEVLFAAATLNLSGHNADARAFCFSHLFVEFCFAFTNNLPQFLREAFFARGANLDTEKRTIPVSYFLVFSLSFCLGSLAVGFLAFWGLRFLEVAPELLDQSADFLIVFFVAKSLFLLSRVILQFASVPQTIQIYENCVFYCFEFLLIYYFVASDQMGLRGLGQALLVSKTLWLLGRIAAFFFHFRDEFHYDFGLPDLIYRLWHDIFAMIEYYLDKGIAVLNINYTLFFLIMRGRTDQVIGLTLMILFYDFCEKFGTAVAKSFKVKYRNLVSVGMLEGVFQRANLQLRVILFLCTATAALGLVVSQGIAFLFEETRPQKNEVSLLVCILGFSAYSFVCSPVLFMLLRINGQESLGYSVMWYLANKYRFILAIPAFWFAAKWGLFGILVANIMIDAFMAMLLFRTFTLYYLMKTLISRPPRHELRQPILEMDDI